MMNDLFYPGPFEFCMGLERGEVAAFFRSHPANGALLAKCRQHVAENPARHLALLPKGAPLLGEFARLVAGWGVVAKLQTLGQEIAVYKKLSEIQPSLIRWLQA